MSERLIWRIRTDGGKDISAELLRQRARGWRGTGRPSPRLRPEPAEGLPQAAARGRGARGPVAPHGGARAPVGCPASGPAWVPAHVVIQRIHVAESISLTETRSGTWEG